MSRLLQLGLVGYDQWQVSQCSGTIAVPGTPWITCGRNSVLLRTCDWRSGQFHSPGKNLAAFFKYYDEYHAIVREAAPSYLGFRGPCGFRSRSRQLPSRRLQTATVLPTPLPVPREQGPQLFAAMLREFRLRPCAITDVLREQSSPPLQQCEGPRRN
jgi:hypothetical protein